MKENNLLTDYPENTVIEAALSTEGQIDRFELIPDQVSASYTDTNLAPMLVTLNFQVVEAFASDAEWTVTILDKDGTAVGSLNTADISGFDSSGYLSFRWLLPDTGEGFSVEVKTSDGAQHSDSAYELSLTTTGVYETDAQIGRLPEGITVEANAKSSSDADAFGFFVDESSGVNALSLEFSKAGTLSLSSSSGEPILVSGTPATNIAVTAGGALSFNLSSAAQFVTVEYTANAAGAYTVALTDTDGSGRVLDAPSVQVGDTVLQDYKQAVYYDSATAPEFVLTSAKAYALSELASVSSGADFVYLIAGASDVITLGGAHTGTVSTSAATPTKVAVADLSTTTVSISADSTLGISAQYDTAFTGADSELALVSSGYIEANLVVSSQGIELSTINTTTPSSPLIFVEGEIGSIKVTLASADTSGDTIVEVVNRSGDVVFANGESTTLVTIAQGATEGSVTFTAKADDIDFNPSESISFTAEVTSGTATGLTVSPLTLTITETIPQFVATPVRQGLLLGSEYVQYEISLTNSDEFSDDEIEVTFSVGAEFKIGSASNSISSSNLILNLGGASDSVNLYVAASSSVLSAETFSGAISNTVKVGTAASQIKVPSISLVRISDGASKVPDVNGTTGDDGFYSTSLNETFNGLAGDDTLILSSDVALVGTFNGGDGTDLLVLDGAQALYTTANIDGSTYVKLKASDAEGLAVNSVEKVAFDGNASTIFDLSSLNSPPTIAAAPSAVTVAEGDSLDVDLSSVFIDADGDVLTLRMNSLPSWASFDAGTKVLSINPDYSDSGSAVTLTIDATDTGLFTNPVQTTIDVTITDTNRSPVGSTISGQFVSVDTPTEWSLALNQYFSDPDGNSLTYSVVGAKPSWLTLADGVLAATAPSTDSGSAVVTVQASDSTAAARKSFNLSWGDSPQLELSEAFVGSNITVDIDALVSAYGLSAQDVAVEWQTSSDLSAWVKTTASTTTTLASPTLVNSQPTFVRAKLTYTESGAEQVVTTYPTLVKAVSNNLIEVQFDDHIGKFVTTNIDLDPVITPDSGNAVNLSGYGYDLTQYAADSLPSGTFEMSLAANANMAPDVGISDVIASLRHIVKLDTLTGKAAIAADMDGSGDIGISDVISQLRQIVKLESSSGFKAVVETSEGYTDQLNSDLIEQPLSWVAMGDVDSSYTLDIV